MNLDIPGLTPEMCQARADIDRKCRYDAEHLRDKARERPLYVAYGYLFRAALLEQFPAKPELRVGDLAKYGNINPSRVDYIGKRHVVLTNRRGEEWTESANALTPTGEPAPDDWGQ